MFYQLGLGSIIERRLREVYKLDFKTQPELNSELARVGSESGRFATIDLSSASDSLSVGVLRQILPREFFAWLMCLRVPATKLPDGRLVTLNMISTMGNGFTFPLETLIFTAVVASAYRVAGIPRKRGQWGVFGDDIIVETEVSRHVIRLLHILGFKVNTDKTFIEGPFRESCGGDFFLGHPVRGVYIKSLLTPQDRYVAINLLNDWSAMTGIPMIGTISYLLKTVRRIFTDAQYGLDQGIHAPLDVAEPRRKASGFLTRYFKPRTVYIEIGENMEFSTKWKGKNPNLSGLYLCFLGGYIRSSKISLRQRDIRYDVRTKWQPNWLPPGLNRSKRRFSSGRWETAVRVNLQG